MAIPKAWIDEPLLTSTFVAKLVVPPDEVFLNNETVFADPLVIAMSTFPSPSKSPIAIPLGTAPPVNVIGVVPNNAPPVAVEDK